MSTNLLALAQNALGSEFANLSGQVLGESTASMQSALTSLLPVVLGAIVQKAQTSTGLTQLMGLLDRPDLNTAGLDNVGGLFDAGGQGMNSLIQLGTSTVLPALFGDRTGGLANALAGMTGIKNSSAHSLLAMVAPLLLGFIRRYAAQNNLSGGSLAVLLKGQGQYLSGALDSRLTGALGFSSPTAFLGEMGSTLGSGARAASGAAAVAATSGKSGLMSWLPWLIVLAAIFIVWNIFVRRPEVPEAPVAEPTPAQAPSVGAPAQAPSTSAPAPVMAAFPYKVYFDTGSAVLNADASASLNAAAEVIKKDAVKVTITGYTDRTGDVASNEALAKTRALAVRDALMAAGIAEGDLEMRPPMFVEADAGGDEAQARRVEVNRR